MLSPLTDFLFIQSPCDKLFETLKCYNAYRVLLICYYTANILNSFKVSR